MTKEQVLDLWMKGDGDAIAKEFGLSKQRVSYWKRNPTAKIKGEAEILDFCKRRFAGRRLVSKLVPVA